MKNPWGHEEEKLTAKCVVCKRPLTKLSGSEYRGDPMHMILGPGSRNQMTHFTKIYCDWCGLEYRHLPKEQE